MMNHRVVSDDGLKAVEGGYSIDIRLPWYRGLPLSVVEVMAIELDGATVELANVRFELEGESLALDELKHRTDDVWFVLDSAFLCVKADPLALGDKHDVSVTLAIYPPYIKGYKRITRTSKRLVVH